MAEGGGGRRVGGHSSTPLPVTSQSAGRRQELPTSRGPRSLFLKRCENGYGFTLRHFIVYPPESYTVFQGERRFDSQYGHNGAALDEPMDTIFVKNVYENSPAHAAGLATGDRIISVNGLAVTGCSYAEVVQAIQLSGDYLHLLVVPKENDLLQLYFGETAHNPETNRRPSRLQSPGRGMLQQPPSAVRQYASPPPYRPLQQDPDYSSRRSSEGCSRDQSPFHNERRTSADNWSSSRPVGTRIALHNAPMDSRQYGSQENCLQLPGCRLSLDGGGGGGGGGSRRESSSSLPSTDYLTTSDSKDSLYGSTSTLTGGRSSDDSIIIDRIRKSFEQKEEFLRRPNQPISWSVLENAVKNQQHELQYHQQQQQQQQQHQQQNQQQHQQQHQQQQQHAQQQQQQKKLLSQQQQNALHNTRAVIAREFYARPQKFQRQVWPPTNSSSALTAATVSHTGDQEHSPSRNGSGRSGFAKPLHQSLRRVKSDIDSERDSFTGGSDVGSTCETTERDYRVPFERASSEPCEDRSGNRVQTARLPHGYSHSDTINSQAKTPSAASRPNAGKAPFVTTLSRIHENIPAVDRRQNYNEGQSDDVFHSSQESDSRITSNRQTGDKHWRDSEQSLERAHPEESERLMVSPERDLQLVQQRARQFEEGLLAEDRTSLYRSELARLSAKKSVPNVAVRKREFESRSTTSPPPSSSTRESRRTSRESRSLDSVEPPPGREPSVRLRARSNSAESWAAAARNRIATAPSQWEDEAAKDRELRSEWGAAEEPLRHRAMRQDSYLAAVRAPLSSGSAVQTSPQLPAVIRRQKATEILANEDDRHARRVSYLKATWGDRMHVDSDLELSDSDVPLGDHQSSFAEPTTSIQDDDGEIDSSVITREGWLHCKITIIEGKRAPDRSWRQLWAVLRSSTISLYRASNCSEEEAHVQPLHGSTIEEAAMAGYTKRKNVIRLVTPSGTEVLLQAEDEPTMILWLKALQDSALSLPPVQNTAYDEDAGKQHLLFGGSHLSPQPAHKGIRKLTSFRNRSPTGQSPVNKTRKPSQSDQLPSPKSKTWKGRVARQFKRIQQGSGSPSSPTAPHPEGATIGIPLEECPPSKFSEYVPLLVEMCTNIVDSRGLDIIGIYRVPGNTAAVSSLTESLNKGFDWENMQDPRWNDVNVISSLLKLFFRRLPDSLFTNELYPSFIEADKIEDSNKRFARIKKLVHELPDHHFETLKYLMFHLKKVVAHCHANKMEARNLAIVFGPTLVRAADENMVTMVTDMSHQCRIVESLIQQVDWFFSEEDIDDPNNFPVNLAQDSNELESANQNLLLSNIQKVEGMKGESPNKDISAKDIVSSIISAANRKMQKAKSKKPPGNLASNATEDGRETFTEDQNSVPKLKEENNLNGNEEKEMEQPTSPSLQPSNPHDSTSNDLFSTNVAKNVIKEEELASGHININSISEKMHPDIRKYFSNDDETTWTYSGLSATTQERIRRFEMETKAMLQRDLSRQRHEQERRDLERRSLEAKWQQAKRELEGDDPLDSLADNPSDITNNMPKGSSSSAVTLKQPSSPAATFLTNTIMQQQALMHTTDKNDNKRNSMAMDANRSSVVMYNDPINLPRTFNITEKEFPSRISRKPDEGHPRSLRRGSSAENLQILQEVAQKGVINSMLKKLKTEKETAELSHPLTSLRCGSLDSLHETHFPDQPPSDMSDDGSDLLASFTSTFDRKLKSLLSVPQVSEEEAGKLFRDPSLHRGKPTGRMEASVKELHDAGHTQNQSKESDAERKSNIEQKTVLSDLKNTKVLEKADNSNEEKSDSENTSNIKSNMSVQLSKAEKPDAARNQKIRRSESLTKADRCEILPGMKLRRSESLTKAEKNDYLSTTKLKRSESLSKTEKTESNNTKRKHEMRTVRSYSREKENVAILAKLKRKNGMPERSIKRRHTVGGTKDFDKLHWLDNRLQYQQQQLEEKEDKERRTSSPELSSHSLPDPVPPLESHV